MTLIIACLTPQFVLQASDRRLVYSTGEVKEDTANKAVLFCGHHVFGYTGIAQVGDEPTDYWITRTIATARSLGEALNTLRDAGTEAFRRLPYTRATKRLAIVGVGWGRPSSSAPLAPILSWVTNFSDGSRWLPEARDSFTIGREMTPPNAVRVISAGQQVEDERLEQLTDGLQEFVSRDNAPAAAAQLLAAEIRYVASHNTAVGASLLVSSLPKTAVPANCR